MALGERKMVSLRLPVDLIDQLRAAARQDHRTLTNFMEMQLYEGLRLWKDGLSKEQAVAYEEELKNLGKY